MAKVQTPKLITLQFTGMNNRSSEFAVPQGKVQIANNVQFDNDNNVIFPRAGSTVKYQGTNIHSVFNHPVMVLFVENGDLKRVIDNNRAQVIKAGIGDTPVYYTVVGDTCYWCNGKQTGKVNSGRSMEWGVARPPRQPNAIGTDIGGMFAGDYRVAITWIGSDGEEGGTGMGKRVTVAEGGGIYLSNFPTPPAYVQGLAIYVSSVNGKDMYLYGEYRADLADITLTQKINDIPLQTQFGFPPAPIDRIMAHYGRIYYPRGNKLYHTATRRYGLQIANSYWRLDSEIQTVNPLPGMLVVGTKNRIYRIDNIDGDGAVTLDVIKWYGTVKGTECLDPSANISYVFSAHGFLKINTPTSQVPIIEEISYEDVAMPFFGEGSMTVLEENGLKYLVGAFKMGEPNNMANFAGTAPKVNLVAPSPAPAPAPAPAPIANEGNTYELFNNQTTGFTLTQHSGTIAAVNIGGRNALALTITNSSYQAIGLLNLSAPVNTANIAAGDEFRIDFYNSSFSVDALQIWINGNYLAEAILYMPSSQPTGQWVTAYFSISQAMLTAIGASVNSIRFKGVTTTGTVYVDAIKLVQVEGGSLVPSRSLNTVGGRLSVPAGHVLLADISALPVHPKSAAWLPSFGTKNLDTEYWQVGTPYGIPVNIDNNIGTATMTTYGGSSIQYPNESDGNQFPYRSSYALEQSSPDRHCLVIDATNGIIYEGFTYYYSGSDPVPPDKIAAEGIATPITYPYIGCIAKFNLRSAAMRPLGWTSADAAGLSIAACTISYAEALAGTVQHMARMTVNSTKSWIWPASHKTLSPTGSNTAIEITDATQIPLGAVLRLKASVDVSGFPAIIQNILNGLKIHGAIVADNGIGGLISIDQDPSWNLSQLQLMQSLSIQSNFEIVNMASLMVRPTSYITQGN